MTNALAVGSRNGSMKVRHRSAPAGLGADLSERMIVGDLVNAVSTTYAQTAKNLKDVLPAIDALSKSYGGFKATLSKIAMTAFQKTGGFFGMSAIAGSINAVKAVTAAVAASKKEGVDFEKSKDAFMAIADALKHTDAALMAFRNITLADLVSIGVITESQATTVLERAGFDLRYFKPSLVGFEPLAKSWAKKSGSTIPAGWIDTRWEEYSDVRNKIEKKLIPLAAMMGLTGKYTLEDPSLVDQIKGKLLDEMKKAHDEVKARQKPEGWVSSAFNRAVEIATSQPWLLIFGVAGLVFGHFMGPILNMDLGLTRMTYSAARLVDASAKVASLGITAYAETFQKARVAEKKPEAAAQEEATKALEEKVATAGKAEYEAAYQDIENYRNYSKVVKDALAGFLANLWSFGKWVLLAAVVLAGGGFLASRALQPTQRIEVKVT